jgi:hypothetical protein
MGLDTIAQFVGQADINAQYTPGGHIHKSLGVLRNMHGNYRFGALTADYYGLTGQERQNWLDLAGTYPDDVKQKIKDAIVNALSHKHNGNDAPIPLKLEWKNDSGPPDVKVTYDSVVPSYTIEILNCLPPMAAALASRRERKKTY